MYDERIEFMGAHAAVQVLQITGKKPAVVSASYCEPPEDLAKYPVNSRADFGAALN
jgi:hypothetical protein